MKNEQPNVSREVVIDHLKNEFPHLVYYIDRYNIEADYGRFNSHNILAYKEPGVVYVDFSYGRSIKSIIEQLEKYKDDNFVIGDKNTLDQFGFLTVIDTSKNDETLFLQEFANFWKTHRLPKFETHNKRIANTKFKIKVLNDAISALITDQGVVDRKLLQQHHYNLTKLEQNLVDIDLSIKDFLL